MIHDNGRRDIKNNRKRNCRRQLVGRDRIGTSNMELSSTHWQVCSQASVTPLTPHQNTQGITRTDFSSSRLNFSMTLTEDFNKFSMSAVLQFPSLIQITFGGCPRSMLRCSKSSSLETIAKPFCAAKSQISRSSDVIFKAVLMWAVPGNSCSSESTSFHERF